MGFLRAATMVGVFGFLATPAVAVAGWVSGWNVLVWAVWMLVVAFGSTWLDQKISGR